MPLIVLTQDKKNIWELEVKDIWYEDGEYDTILTLDGEVKRIKQEVNVHRLRCSKGLLGEYSSEENALDALKNIWYNIELVVDKTVAIEIPQDKDVRLDRNWKIERYVDGERK